MSFPPPPPPRDVSKGESTPFNLVVLFKKDFRRFLGPGRKSVLAAFMLAYFNLGNRVIEQFTILGRFSRPNTENATIPPSSLILDLILPIEMSTDAVANLEEKFESWVSRYGERVARRIYRFQAWRIATRYIIDRVFDRAGQVVKLIRLSF
jgi:hypothetical protein